MRWLKAEEGNRKIHPPRDEDDEAANPKGRQESSERKAFGLVTSQHPGIPTTVSSGDRMEE